MEMDCDRLGCRLDWDQLLGVRKTPFTLGFLLDFRPPLKIILFPVHRPGDPISAEWVIFVRVYGFFSFFRVFSLSFIIYLKKII